jgi:hypothetical protein
MVNLGRRRRAEAAKGFAFVAFTCMACPLGGTR